VCQAHKSKTKCLQSPRETSTKMDATWSDVGCNEGVHNVRRSETLTAVCMG
jgi:hypothetical protein